jgi:hypothetical protein
MPLKVKFYFLISVRCVLILVLSATVHCKGLIFQTLKFFPKDAGARESLASIYSLSFGGMASKGGRERISGTGVQ